LAASVTLIRPKHSSAKIVRDHLAAFMPQEEDVRSASLLEPETPPFEKISIT
jgi:hypothetical protein